jgi:hypothetical protein
MQAGQGASGRLKSESYRQSTVAICPSPAALRYASGARLAKAVPTAAAPVPEAVAVASTMGSAPAADEFHQQDGGAHTSTGAADPPTPVWLST